MEGIAVVVADVVAVVSSAVAADAEDEDGRRETIELVEDDRGQGVD